MTATKFAPEKIPGEGPLPIIDLDAHRKDMARRQAENDAQRELLQDCIDPAIAKKHEHQKPMHEYTVTASWFGTGPDGPGRHGPYTRKVVGQHPQDAWARFCDKIEKWPSFRDAKPTIKIGKRLTQDEAEAAISLGNEDGEVRRYEDPATHKSRKN